MKSLIPWKNKERDTAPVLWDDDWFDRSLDSPFMGLFEPFASSLSSRMPSVDVSEDKNEVTVRAEIPGLTEKDVDLTWQDGVLRIHGEKRAEKEEKRKDRYYRECSFGSFRRDIPLGDSVDWNRAQAQYKNGVLTVKLPKTEKARKAIEIKVN
jgi:HSP20 family protein